MQETNTVKNMNHNDMPCSNCHAKHCSNNVHNVQEMFVGLQVTGVDTHDQTLVGVRMLGVASSAKSKKLEKLGSRLYKPSSQKHSDFWLTRFMASYDKLASFLQRRQRAKTHMEAHAHLASPQRSNTN
jgi:hypothetical protein